MNGYSRRAIVQIPAPMGLIIGRASSGLTNRKALGCIFVSTAVKITQIAQAFVLNLDGQIHATNQEPRQSIGVGQLRCVASLRPCQQACGLDRRPLKMTQRAKSIELLLMDVD